MTAELPQDLPLDLAIVGGGIAAMWTAVEAIDRGLSVLILVQGELGGEQSVSAQGVVHGGMKYALGGKLTESSQALANMPGRWEAALRGDGPVDLRGASLLSDHQVMWSLPSVMSKVVGFFGSKALVGRSESLLRDQYPAPLQNEGYKGKAFRIDEPVIDPPSVTKCLAAAIGERAISVEWGRNARWLAADDGCSRIELSAPASGVTYRLRPQRTILAAGRGNESMLKELGIETQPMQIRPLHQVIVRSASLPPFYSVCIGTSPKPPFVVTTHVDAEGRTVWYVGGDIAEAAGVQRSECDQIAAAQKLLSETLPWLDWQGSEWFTHRVDRAEPFTGTGDRPPGAYCVPARRGDTSLLVGWPTKWALAPDFAEHALAELQPLSAAPVPEAMLNEFSRPAQATAPWDRRDAGILFTRPS